MVSAFGRARFYVFAKYNLGVIHYHGRGVERDKTKAAAWYRKLRNRAMQWRKTNLGAMLYLGDGIASNQQEAVEWFRRAAKQGYAAAQSNLGSAYDNGRGVAKDHREAVKWFRRAAKQEHSEASLVPLGARLSAWTRRPIVSRSRTDVVHESGRKGPCEWTTKLGLLYSTA